MKLAELIKKTTWPSVRSSVRRLFGHEEEIDPDAFKEFFYALKYNTTPVVSNISLRIIIEINPVTGKKGYQVSGINLKTKKCLAEFRKLIEEEYTSWDKWLGMEVDDETLKELSIVEIIGVCMLMMHVINSQPKLLLDKLEEFLVSNAEDEKKSVEEKIGELISYKDLKDFFCMS